MKAPCGQEDCGHTISKLVKALKRIEDMTIDYVGTSQAAGDIAKVAHKAIEEASNALGISPEERAEEAEREAMA